MRIVKAPQVALMYGSGLRTIWLGRGERILIQNETHMGWCRRLLQKEEKHSKRVSHFLIRWKIKGGDTRKPKAKKLCQRKIKHGPTGLPLLLSLPPAHRILLPHLMGNKHGLEILAWNRWVSCCHTSHSILQNSKQQLSDFESP